MPEPHSPGLLYVSTLDHILWAMRPQLDAARARGWRVHVACHVTRSREEILKHADEVHDLPFKRFPLHPANIVALIALLRLMKQNRYTVVHTHNPTGGFVGRLAATLSRPRPLRVYTAHGFHFHQHGGRVSNVLYKIVEGFAGRFLSDAVQTINREDYETARGSVVPADKLFFTSGVGVSAREIFNPALVSAPERLALRREMGAESESTPVLIFVGEMIPRKRHTDVFAAFVRIRAVYPDAVLGFGGVGVLMESLKADAQTLGIADNVKFLGFRRDVAALLAASDVFLFPSQQEGLPSSVQESLSMALPTVATSVRGNTDLMPDGTGGFLVPPHDPDAMARCALQILALPPGARRAMGWAGRERMLKTYDRAECVAEQYRLYDDLLAARQGKAA